jgi:hypothetical protein
MHAQHSAAREHRRCSRCHGDKPLGDFYRNPASTCKQCHNAATRANSEIRRTALARLVNAHQAEYRRLLAAERARRRTTRKPAEGVGGEAA